MNNEQLTAHYMEMLENHQLSLIAEGDGFYSFYLKNPSEGRMCSCLITFSPEGITITGDLTPERNGTCSVYAKGLGWFSGTLSPGYLAEKFLVEKFTTEEAIRELKDNTHWLRDPEYHSFENEERELPKLIEDLEQLIYFLDGSGKPEHEIYEFFCDHDICTSDGIPGWNYLPREICLLSAIQTKFSSLIGGFWERYNKEKESEEILSESE